MDEWFFNIDTGKTNFKISDSEAVDLDGNFYTRVSDNAVMNLDTGSIDFIDSWPGSSSFFDD